MSYLIFGKVGSTLAESDHPNGSPRVRIVDFKGDATRRIVCKFAIPWAQAPCAATATELETTYGLSPGDLVAEEVTEQEYRDLNDAVYAAIRAAQEQAREDRRAELRQILADNTSTAGNLVGTDRVFVVPADPGDQKEFLRALWFAMKELVDAGIDV